jgi:diguanylate cyclase (GGDEF)-like protein/PAS domain S-box-containing protein
MEGTGGTGTPREADTGFDRLLLAPDTVLEGLPDAVVAATRDGRIVFVNSLAEELFGYSQKELIGQPVERLWPERVRERYLRNMETYFATAHPLRFTSEAWGLRRDGTEFVGEMSWGILETTAGPLLLAIGRDVSARQAEEARLRGLAAISERALAGSNPADLAGDALELVRSTLPVPAAEIRLASGDVLARYGPATASALSIPIGNEGEMRLLCERALTEPELSAVRALANTLAGALARLRSEERMRHDALHDPLTGLANRVLLRDRLEHALARSAREGEPTGVAFVDLDHFKAVNDLHGHASGDALLAELARRMRAAVRPADTVARYGGDEFVVVCEGVDADGLRHLGQRLLDAVRQPVTLGGTRHQISASVGLALGLEDPDGLISAADDAVYGAKAKGGGIVELTD